MKAILAGGPRHGERLDVTDPAPYLSLVTTDHTGLPLALWPARPSRWRHPLLWRRWHPPLVAALAESQHTYHRVGQLADGTAVYWHAGTAVEIPEDPEALIRHLYQVAARAAPWARAGCHWEMGPEWFAALRQLPDPRPGPPPDSLAALWALPILSYPVKVSWGPPRLTPYDQP